MSSHAYVRVRRLFVLRWSSRRRHNATLSAQGLTRGSWATTTGRQEERFPICVVHVCEPEHVSRFFYDTHDRARVADQRSVQRAFCYFLIYKKKKKKEFVFLENERVLSFFNFELKKKKVKILHSFHANSFKCIYISNLVWSSILSCIRTVLYNYWTY